MNLKVERNKREGLNEVDTRERTNKDDVVSGFIKSLNLPWHLSFFLFHSSSPYFCEMFSMSRKLKRLVIVFFLAGICGFSYSFFKLYTFPGMILHAAIPGNQFATPKEVLAEARTTESMLPHCDPNDRIVKSVNCKAILNMNETELIRALNVMKQMKPTSEKELLRQVANCNAFKKKQRYILHSSREEMKFPVAYSILLYKDVVQVEKLLRAIYRPQNWYCLHIDAKAPFQLHYAVMQLVSCFNNVFIASKLEEVVYSSFSRLQADINCMTDLISRNGSWKYFINLPSQVYPLKTNAELVKILKIYNGANDIEGITGKRILPERFQYRHYIYWSRKGETSYIKRTSKRKAPPPHKISIVKGSAYGVFSKGFVQFALFDKRAQDLLKWMEDISSPDEYFWATLNHLKINMQLNTPGGYRGDPNTKPWLASYAGWRENGDPCFGRWVRNICVFGIGDILYLTEKKHLFANKFYIDQQPLALDCLEEWLLSKTCRPVTLDLDYYRNLPFVNK